MAMVVGSVDPMVLLPTLANIGVARLTTQSWCCNVLASFRCYEFLDVAAFASKRAGNHLLMLGIALPGKQPADPIRPTLLGH